MRRLIDRRRRAGRELPARHARAARARARRPHRPQPAPRGHPHHRLRPGRPLRGPPRLRDPGRGDVGLRRHQRRAGRWTAAPADRADRRGGRARRCLRDDGRGALRRRPGGGRQPPGVALPAHGPARHRTRADRLRAAAPRLRHPVLGAARHLPLRGRSLGGHLLVGRDGGRAGDAAGRARATIRASRPSRAGWPTARRSTASSGTGWRPARSTRCSRRSRPRTRRLRPSSRWPTSSAIRTTGPARRSSTVDGVPMQGLVARLSATPGRIRWSGRPEDADRAEIAPRSSDRATDRGAGGRVISRRERWRPRCGPAASPAPR